VRVGEAFVSVSATSGLMSGVPGIGTLPMPGLNVPAQTMSENALQWRERTGAKTGWLIKSDEEKMMKLSGSRCTKCGYVEFNAHE